MQLQHCSTDYIDLNMFKPAVHESYRSSKKLLVLVIAQLIAQLERVDFTEFCVSDNLFSPYQTCLVLDEA